tara:strand:- start:85 stop:630 length:546 start_codon:yes stop_codon:yes gene_type:complete
MHDWLLGYPKSGNTWMAHALHALLTGEGAKSWDEVQYTVPNWDRVGFEAEPCPHGWVRGHCTPGVVATDVAERILYVVRHPGAVIASSFRARHREIHGKEIEGEGTIDGGIYACHDKAYNREGLLGVVTERRRFNTVWTDPDTADRAKAIMPWRDCQHHCAASAANKTILDFLSITHGEFV